MTARVSTRQLVDLAKSRLDPRNRYVDLAAQFFVAEKNRRGQIVPTGDESPIYGGRWDRWVSEYDAPADVVRRLPCSERQFELLMCGSPVIEAAGGRGSGKSEAAVLMAIKYILERPGADGRIISPSFPLSSILWQKLLEQIDQLWLLPDLAGRRIAERELRFQNGVRVQFRSANNPDSLRSWGGHWIVMDECQDITSYAVQIGLYCLRETDTPRMLQTLTPKSGETFQRHLANLEDKNTACMVFNSFENPFSHKTVYDLSGGSTDEQTYQVEILADWDTVAAMEEAAKPLIVYGFTREKHCMGGTPPDIGTDVTARVTARRTRRGFKYICGVDYNFRTRHYGVIYRVYRVGNSNKWIAVDVVTGKGNASGLAKALKSAGYGPHETVLIADASGEYSGGKKSSERHMREAGYLVLHHTMNPPIQDRAAAFNAKVSPHEGGPHWACCLPQCEELALSLETVSWGTKGRREAEHKQLIQVENSKELWDPTDVYDAASYPIEFFEPAGARAVKRARGIQVN